MLELVMRNWRLWLVLIGVVGLLFLPYFRDKKIPVPIDIPVAMYYPWLNHNYGYAVRPPVKNPILTDTVSQFWIWRNWAVEGLKKGEVKIWNPYSLSGTPMSPWFHTILLSPLNIFYFLTNTLDAMAWIIISQIIIGMIGAYLFFKSVAKSEWGAIAFAIAFVTSTYFVGWLTWGTVSLALAFLPWILFYLNKLLHDNKGQIGLTLSLAVTIFSGHPQTIFYVYLIVLIYFLSAKNCWSKIKSFIIVNLLALGFGAIILLPSIKIIAESIRGKENILTDVNFGFILWSKIVILLISPNFFGNPGTNNYWGGGYNFQETLVNFGIIALIAVIYYLLKNRRNKFLLITFATGLLLSTQYPVGWMIYYFKIPLLSSGPAGRAMIITIFSGCLMLGYFIKEILENKLDKKILFKTIYLIGLTIIFLLAYAFFVNSKIGFRNTLFSAIILTLCFFVLHTRKNLCVALLLILVFFENWQFFKKYTPFVDKKLYFPTTESLNFLINKYQNGSDWFRVERESAELLPPNMWQQFKLASTSGYDPAYLATYGNYLKKAGMTIDYSRYVENGNKNISKINELGIKYLLVLKKDNIIPKWVDQKVWKEVSNEGPVVVLENQNYVSPFKLMSNNKDNTIKLKTKKEDEWRFDTIIKESTKLVVFENMTSDWHVTIDGEKHLLQPYEGTFLSVDLPAGQHEVIFKYKNYFWQIGEIISLISAIMLKFL